MADVGSHPSDSIDVQSLGEDWTTFKRKLVRALFRCANEIARIAGRPLVEHDPTWRPGQTITADKARRLELRVKRMQRARARATIEAVEATAFAWAAARGIAEEVVQNVLLPDVLTEAAYRVLINNKEPTSADWEECWEDWADDAVYFTSRFWPWRRFVPREHETFASMRGRMLEALNRLPPSFPGLMDHVDEVLATKAGAAR